jgi:NADH dehydrogenase [ubiquinone] 1 alpha subcomplex assembly factor 1
MQRFLLLITTILMSQQAFVLIDFNSQSNKNWEIVNDDVMGGISQSSFSINEQGHGVFKGEVSLANKGGFASVRFDIPPLDVSNYTGVRISLKGDGKPYQFRIRNSYLNRYSYSVTFPTNQDWQIIEVPFATMIATFRGYRLDLPRYEGDKIEEFGFLIGNKKEESFKLLVDRIELY